jgi:hypothetical protein
MDRTNRKTDQIMSKTLYHSELVNIGPARAVVASNVTPSKFDGKPPWVALDFQNGMPNRLYNVENDACGKAFDGHVGELVFFQAFGSRDTATIQITDAQPAAGGHPPTQPAQPHAPAPSQDQPPAFDQAAPQPPQSQAPQPSSSAGNVDETLAKVSNLMCRALQGARYVDRWYAEAYGQPLTPDQFQAITSTIFIAADRRGGIDEMSATRLPIPAQS